MANLVGGGVLWAFPGFTVDDKLKDIEKVDLNAIQKHCKDLKVFVYVTRAMVCTLALVDLVVYTYPRRKSWRGSSSRTKTAFVVRVRGR